MAVSGGCGGGEGGWGWDNDVTTCLIKKRVRRRFRPLHRHHHHHHRHHHDRRLRQLRRARHRRFVNLFADFEAAGTSTELIRLHRAVAPRSLEKKTPCER